MKEGDILYWIHSGVIQNGFVTVMIVDASSRGATIELQESESVPGSKLIKAGSLLFIEGKENLYTKQEMIGIIASTISDLSESLEILANE